MRSTVFVTSLLLGGLVAVVASESTSWADPVVIANFSGIFGQVNIHHGGVLLNDEYNHPITGSGSIADTRAVTDSGVTAMVSTAITTQLSPRSYSASGQYAGSAFSDLSQPNIRALVFGASDLNITFRLFEPHAYSYNGQYQVFDDHEELGFGGDGGKVALARLDTPSSPAFDDYFNQTGVFDRQHSGILGPGLYRLFASASSDGMEFVASRDVNLGYQVTLELTPVAAPTPEPASLVLLGTGVLGVVSARARRRSK